MTVSVPGVTLWHDTGTVLVSHGHYCLVIGQPSCSVQCAAWAPQSMQIIIISALQEIELPSSGQTSWNEMDVKLDWGWKYPLVLIAGFVTVDETQRLCHVSIQASSLNWRKHATENCQLSKAHCWLVNWQCSILLIGFRNALFVEFL